MSDLSFAIISDLHIPRTPDERPMGVDAASKLSAVLRQIQETEPLPEFVIALGDLVDDPSAQGYAHLRSLWVDFGIPIYPALGNHDLLANFPAALRPNVHFPLPGSLCYSFEAGLHLALVLDSSSGEHAAGRLGAEQLAWVEATLQANHERPVLVFVHHPPTSIAQAFLDSIGLVDGPELITLLEHHGSVVYIFCGHIHQSCTIVRRHVAVTSVIATSVAFDPLAQGEDLSPSTTLTGYTAVWCHPDRVISKSILLRS